MEAYLFIWTSDPAWPQFKITKTSKDNKQFDLFLFSLYFCSRLHLRGGGKTTAEFRAFIGYLKENQQSDREVIEKRKFCSQLHLFSFHDNSESSRYCLKMRFSPSYSQLRTIIKNIPIMTTKHCLIFIWGVLPLFSKRGTERFLLQVKIQDNWIFQHIPLSDSQCIGPSVLLIPVNKLGRLGLQLGFFLMLSKSGSFSVPPPPSLHVIWRRCVCYSLQISLPTTTLWSR